MQKYIIRQFWSEMSLQYFRVTQVKYKNNGNSKNKEA